MSHKLIDYTPNLSFYFGTSFAKLAPPILLNIDGLYGPVKKDKNPHFYRDDWAMLALRGFLRLRDMKSIRIKSFLNIGTGSALDTLGAIEALDLSDVLMTELFSKSVEKAQLNVIRNLQKGNAIKVDTVQANALNLDGLRQLKAKRFDLIYENLPNLPGELNDLSVYKSQPVEASFTTASLDDVPKIYKQYLLGSHYLALRNLKPFLAVGGGIMCNIGGRIPYELIVRMCRDLKYEVSRLVYELKMQSEADWNLRAYSKWEESNSGIEFAFYRGQLRDSKEIVNFDQSNCDRVSGYADAAEEFDRLIAKGKLSAKEALKVFDGGKVPIAHTVNTILARPVG